jgi:hypothetical protein
MWANDCQMILSQSKAAVYNGQMLFLDKYKGDNRLFIKAASVFPQLP